MALSRLSAPAFTSHDTRERTVLLSMPGARCRLPTSPAARLCLQDRHRRALSLFAVVGRSPSVAGHVLHSAPSMSTTNTLEAYLPQNLKAWMTSGPAQECRRPVERRIEEPVHLPRPSPEDIELASLPSLQSSASPEMPATPPLPGSPVGAAVAAAVAQAAEQQQVQEQLAAATAARQPDPAPPVYAYCHAFDVAHRSVSILKWAPNGSSMLAWGAADGIVFVATADAPPRLLQASTATAAAELGGKHAGTSAGPFQC